MSDKKPSSFGNDALRQQLAKLRTAKPAEKPAAPAPVPVPIAKPSMPSSDEDGDALFRMVMDDVKPIRPAAIDQHPVDSSVDDAEVLARLAELVATVEGLDVTETDDATEGIAPGGDHALLGALKDGKFPVSASLDLRSLRPEVARTKLDDFIVQHRKAGRRCVRINPSGDVAVIVRWLSKGKLSRIVLAFRLDRAGDGSLLTLLRR